MQSEKPPHLRSIKSQKRRSSARVTLRRRKYTTSEATTTTPSHMGMVMEGSTRWTSWSRTVWLSSRIQWHKDQLRRRERSLALPSPLMWQITSPRRSPFKDTSIQTRISSTLWTMFHEWHLLRTQWSEFEKWAEGQFTQCRNSPKQTQGMISQAHLLIRSLSKHMCP